MRRFPAMDVVVLIGLAEVVGLICVVRLWRTQDATLRKVLWSLVLLIPVIGPLAYGALYGSPPESLPYTDRVRDNGAWW